MTCTIFQLATRAAFFVLYIYQQQADSSSRQGAVGDEPTVTKNTIQQYNSATSVPYHVRPTPMV